MPNIDETDKAKKVVAHAKNSVNGFLDAFTTVRKNRSAKGAPTDEDQDLARAALVFAAAGLDSCIKHLIKESIHSLSLFDQKVHEQLDKFVKKVIMADSPDRLASALLADSPRQDLVDSYIYELTGSSLQSFEELAKAAGALGITINTLNQNKKGIIEIFSTRNKIIHELDVKFEAQQGQRDRNSRTKTKLENDAKLLLTIADEFITAVDNKIENNG
jgi:RiboL-PSP-HEPN